jgi:hypothetical protein
MQGGEQAREAADSSPIEFLDADGDMIKVLVLLLTSLLNGDSDALTWNFEQDAPGAKPAGFLFEQTGKTPPGQWEIVDDGGARVLAQIDRSRDPARYALAVVDDS